MNRQNFIEQIEIPASASITPSFTEDKNNPKGILFEEILRKTTNVDSFIHNAEVIIPDFETLQNTTNISAIELDIYSQNGRAVIGHSETEIVRTPKNTKEFSGILGQIKNNGFELHIDLKSPDIGVARQVHNSLPPKALISTPHHELLDDLQKRNTDKVLLYTINTPQKKAEFERRIFDKELFKNSGVSIHFKYLIQDDVKFYQEHGLYVLAYTVDTVDTAANLCKYGVNGITSNNLNILNLIAHK